MGLNSSKARRKVTKVAPMSSKAERLDASSSVAVYTFQNSPQEMRQTSVTSWMGRNPVLERHLPPLRETWQGRYATGPRPLPLDLTTEWGEASIIKQHPPRRLQKLKPFILANDTPPDKYASLQGGTAACKAKKELEKGGEAVIHPAGRRQYLLKMKMLEIRKEAELKRRLHQEARLNQPKTRDLNIQGTRGHVQINNSSEDDEDLFAIERDQTFNGHHDDLWSGGLYKEHRPPESHLGQRGKVETWLLKQQARRESSSDASSTDSDTWNGFGKPCRRPALVRTKTERIALFDEFFDREF
ncbi:factor associated with metabolism and energy [Elgaria multicarinata webbii]|uniref:factor associated with metabolism and energy n=1 Tax=Elgaria multicarinata webbii TaxID=159646 RepID=UPI002FCCDB48